MPRCKDCEYFDVSHTCPHCSAPEDGPKDRMPFAAEGEGECANKKHFREKEKGDDKAAER